MPKPNDMPAFPSHGSMGEVCQEGMTLRDWFAGQIIMGNIARAKPGYEFSSNKELAKLSYEMADAMLKAREEGTND